MFHVREKLEMKHEKMALYRFDLLVDGVPLKEYRRPDLEDAVFVQRVLNKDFVLRIWNDSGMDIEAVPSVDGRLTMTGEPGDYLGRGWLVRAYSHFDVEGWLVASGKEGQISRFYFAPPGESYSERMGNGADHSGVAAIAIFRKEFYRPMREPYHPPLRPCDRFDVDSLTREITAVPTRESYGGDTGAGFGDIVARPSQEVEFKRADPNRPDAVLKIYFGSRKQLRAWGVRFEPYPALPEPFPGNVREPVGCPIPPDMELRRRTRGG